MFAKQHAKHHDICPAMVVADEQIPVFLIQAIQALYIPFKPWIKTQQQGQPFTPAVHHKIAKTDIERQTAGIGTRSLISPATMIGTEQIMVTMIVRAILSGSVIAASNLDIVNLFRKLD